MILDAAEHDSTVLAHIEVGQVHLSLRGGLAAGDGGRKAHSPFSRLQDVFPTAVACIGKEFLGFAPVFVQALDDRQKRLFDRLHWRSQVQRR